MALCAILLLMFSGSDGIATLYRSYREVKKAKVEIVQLQHTIDSLEQEIHRLKTDSSYIEEIAREKLGMAKPNETVYKFVEKEDQKK